MFIVFDLDGTLACCKHRVHHIDKEAASEKDWDAFYDACPDDDPLHAALNVMKALIRAGHEVQIWTGRSDRVREETEEWLWQPEHLGRYMQQVELIMRPANDRRPDTELKRKWINDHGCPDLVFEDRASVVAMWREEEVACFQVAPGEF